MLKLTHHLLANPTKRQDSKIAGSQARGVAELLLLDSTDLSCYGCDHCKDAQ